MMEMNTVEWLDDLLREDDIKAAKAEKGRRKSGSGSAREERKRAKVLDFPERHTRQHGSTEDIRKPADKGDGRKLPVVLSLVAGLALSALVLTLLALQTYVRGESTQNENLADAGQRLQTIEGYLTEIDEAIAANAAAGDADKEKEYVQLSRSVDELHGQLQDYLTGSDMAGGMSSEETERIMTRLEGLKADLEENAEADRQRREEGAISDGEDAARQERIETQLKAIHSGIEGMMADLESREQGNRQMLLAELKDDSRELGDSVNGSLSKVNENLETVGLSAAKTQSELSQSREAISALSSEVKSNTDGIMQITAALQASAAGIQNFDVSLQQGREELSQISAGLLQYGADVGRIGEIAEATGNAVTEMSETAGGNAAAIAGLMTRMDEAERALNEIRAGQQEALRLLNELKIKEVQAPAVNSGDTPAEVPGESSAEVTAEAPGESSAEVSAESSGESASGASSESGSAESGENPAGALTEPGDNPAGELSPED